MTPLQKYYRLLHKAYDASNMVDQFDLDSTSEESKKEWGGLNEIAVHAQLDLIRFVLTTPNIKEILKSSI